MRQYNCPECGHAFPIAGEGVPNSAECPNCNRLIPISNKASPRGAASLLPGTQFLRGHSYGWYSALIKGRRG